VIAKVLESWPEDKVSHLSGIGVPTAAPAYWSEIKNATPKELHVGEAVQCDIRRDGRGVVSFSNIRILVGKSERLALNGRALRPKFDKFYENRER
jgi:hypothetical protein